MLIGLIFVVDTWNVPWSTGSHCRAPPGGPGGTGPPSVSVEWACVDTAGRQPHSPRSVKTCRSHVHTAKVIIIYDTCINSDVKMFTWI